MKRYPVKKIPFGSAVIEIIRYKQTEKQTDIQTYTLHYKDTIKLLITFVMPDFIQTQGKINNKL